MKTARGFTLVELLVVVAIIAILSAIAFVVYTEVQKGVRDARRKQDLRSIQTALEIYYQKNGRYPCTAGDSPPPLYSNGTDDWLTDSGCSSSGTRIQFHPDYMDKTPNDPKANAFSYSDSGSYGYSYWPIMLSGGTCPSSGGQYYILVTNLENRSDSDRHATRQYKLCNQLVFNSSSTGASANRFIITSQD